MTSRSNESLPSAETLAQLMKTVENTDIEELELRWGDVRVRLLQNVTGVFVQAARSGESAQPRGVAIVAPLTGVFYARPSPDQPPFVEVGGQVLAGQVVGLIETMKLFNEIVSEFTGEIVDVIAGEGDLVETGQALLRVATKEEGSAS